MKLFEMLRRSLFEAIMIVLAAVVLALVSNALRPDGIPLFGRGKAPEPQTEACTLHVVDIDEAIEKYTGQTAVFVDARLPESYFAGHIPGAVNLPEYYFDEKIEEFMVRFDPQTAMITYCNNMDCPQAWRLAEKLCVAGYEKVSCFAGGLTRWIEFYMPVEKDLERAINR
ncbi:MAG: rhodanese-like domain-containing protein [Desulfobacterales bacterium]